MKKASLRIGILGHYGDLNLGDEATIQAVIQNIREASNDWTPCCFSVYPDDSRDRHGVESFPIQPVSDYRREQQALRTKNLDVQTKEVDETAELSRVDKLRDNLKRFAPLVFLVKSLRRVREGLSSSAREISFLISSFRTLKDFDILLVAGSNQCFDYVDGPWYFPFNLLKWSVMARLRGKTLAFVSVGAGPIKAELSRKMMRKSLSLSHYRSFRDSSSREVISMIGAGQADDHIMPDLAFSLHIAPGTRNAAVEEKRAIPVIGINPMPLFDPRFREDGDPRMYNALVSKYVDFVTWLLDRDYPIFFYATHPKDVLVVDDIVEIVGPSRFDSLEYCFPGTVDKLMSKIAKADIVVATRFHGILLPYILGIPVLGIEYWTKTRDLMEYMRQSDYLLPQSRFVDDHNDFDLIYMTKRFDSLVTNIRSERLVIETRLAELQADLAAQYDQLWAIAGETNQG